MTGRKPNASKETKKVALFCADGVQALDITGPASVFSAANDASPSEVYKIIVVSPEGGLVSTMSGVEISTRSTRQLSARSIDTLLVGGHQRAQTEALIANKAAQRWVTNVTRQARRWGSVCSGSFPLAAWGLIENRQATTHWRATEELADRFPTVRVDHDALFVVDDKLWTSAGVTAGIDMALAMVEADLGKSIASSVAQQLVVYLRRPGSQSQFSAPLKHQCSASEKYRDLMTWASMHLNEDLSVDRLAARANQSTRTFQRHFAKDVGRSPATAIEDLRLERAKLLIDKGVRLESIASEVGYRSSSQLTAVFRRRLGVTPSHWKTMHHSA